MVIYTKRQFSTTRELSNIYILSIGLSDNGIIVVNFTIDQSARDLFLKKMEALNPEIKLLEMQTYAQDNSAEYGWRTDNQTFITTISELKESSLISIEFADEICRELPHLNQLAQDHLPYINFEGFDIGLLKTARRYSIGSILAQTYPVETDPRLAIEEEVDQYLLQIANSVDINMGPPGRSAALSRGGMFSSGSSVSRPVELPPSRHQFYFYSSPQRTQALGQNYDLDIGRQDDNDSLSQELTAKNAFLFG